MAQRQGRQNANGQNGPAQGLVAELRRVASQPLPGGLPAGVATLSLLVVTAIVASVMVFLVRQGGDAEGGFSGDQSPDAPFISSTVPDRPVAQGQLAASEESTAPISVSAVAAFDRLADTQVETSNQRSDRGRARSLNLAKSSSQENRPVFRFPTAGLAPGFSSAHLRLFVSDEEMEPDDSYRIHVERILQSFGWTEGNADAASGCVEPELCWATYPDPSLLRRDGDFLDLGQPAKRAFITVPMGNTLTNSLAEGETSLSIALAPMRLSGQDSQDEFMVKSKEAGEAAQRPMLVVRYGDVEVTVLPDADTWIDSGPTRSDRGAATSTGVGKSTFAERRAAFRFPTTDIEPGFGEAHLKLYVADEKMEADDRYRLHVVRIVESFEWTEGNGNAAFGCVEPELCLATYPNESFLRMDGDFIELGQPAVGSYLMVPVTNALNASLADGESSLSIVLVAERLSGVDGLDEITFRTKETSNPDQRPILVTTPTTGPQPPVARNDSYSVAEGGTLDVPAPGVLGNDTDADGDDLTAILVSSPAHGALTLNSDGSFTYAHNGSETTSDSFTYKANDGTFDSNVATVSITINPVNDAPVANNDSYTVAEGGILNAPAPGVLGNDTDAEGNPLTAILVSDVSHGALTLNANGSFTYVHDGSETTSDSFTYKANDGAADSNVATVSIAIDPVNDAPVAADDSYSVNEGGTLDVPPPGVLGNDTDAEGDTLTAILVSAPANGALTLNADGSFSYTHNGSETTSDSFTYRANDGAADSNVATVSITIDPVNDAPVANNDSYSVEEGDTLSVPAPGVLGNDTDAEGDTLTAVLVSDVSHGTLTLNADGSFTYEHDGSDADSDSFTYRASDGELDSNVATVTISIALNTAPVAADDQYSVNEGGTLNVPAPGVLGNDTDAEGDALTAILVSGPANGALTFNADGSFSYVHNGSETSSDSFTYQANDGFSNSNVATVSITVNPVNDAPFAGNDSYSVAEGGALNVPAPGVLGNDTDAEGNGLTAMLVSAPAHGALTFNADGSFTYVHNGSETTSDSFTYQASDGLASSNIATVSITISPVNDAPVANNDSYNVDEGETLSVPAPGVLGNDTDAEGSPLTAVLVSDVSHGALTLNPDGSFTYVHDGSKSSSDSFTYRANDGLANSNVATVNIAINLVNEPPVANDDEYSVDEGDTLDVPAPGVLDNDTDADGDPLTAILVSDVSHGALTLNADGSFSYVHDGSETNSDSFTYKANDGAADSNVATVNIAITPVNDAPVAADDGYDTTQGAALNVEAPGVLANDTDAEGEALTAILMIEPENGALTLNADGSFSYTPNAGFAGTDTFTYVANDGIANSNVATVSINVNPLVLPAPQLTSPAPNAVITDTTPTFRWETVDAPVPVMYELQVSSEADFDPMTLGFPVVVNGTSFTVPDAQPLAPGQHFWRVRAIATGSQGEFSEVRTFTILEATPTPVGEARITITFPGNLEAFAASPITVRGTVTRPEIVVSITVNGVLADLVGSEWTAQGVALKEGMNVVEARALDNRDRVTSDVINVRLDTIPPRVAITTEDGLVTTEERITIFGNVQDTVIGTVSESNVTVTVNGIAAVVANRTFQAANVPLQEGKNTITAIARDEVGNVAVHSITVIRNSTVKERIRIVSGNNQTAQINTALAEPLVVRMETVDGAPIAGRQVVFRVIEGSGTIVNETALSPVRAIVATTDDEGMANVSFTLGERSGSGNHKVKVSSLGVVADAVFTASATPKPPDKINIAGGNNQQGEVGQPLAHPLIAIATDDGNNRIAGLPLTFTVVQGGGRVNGQRSVTVLTDSDGRAAVQLRLGTREGFDNNRVEVTFEGQTSIPAVFVASALEPGDPRDTVVTGIVLDNSDNPIPGVTMHIMGFSATDVTDEQGQFELTFPEDEIPLGFHMLAADGRTVTTRNISYEMHFEIDIVPGVVNTLPSPIYLLPLIGGKLVGGDVDVTFTLDDVPGFSFTVLAGSATFGVGDDARTTGFVSVTRVNSDKVPMPPPNGMQWPLVVTIQPADVRFDPPAPFTLPNIEGFPPGAKAELYSFDHDLGAFVSVGTGTVSEDGSIIRSDPGFGIVKGGWHGGGGPSGPGGGGGPGGGS